MNLIHPPGYLYGEYLRSGEIPDFKLAEGEYQRGMKTPHHSHEHALLCFVLKGAYVDTCRTKIRTHKQSTVFFLPPGEAHLSDFRSTSVRIFRVEVNPQRLKRIREYSAVLDCPVDFDGGGLPRLATRLYGEFKRMDATAPLAIEGLILEMIAEASRSSARTNGGQPPVWLQQARDLLHDRFAEKLSLAEIAKPVGVHPIYLASEFHRRYGSTIGEYLRQLRLEYACGKLARSDDSIVDIALQAGFSDQSHFCKVFKRLMGMTPRQYRASFRSPEPQVFELH